MSHIFSLLTSTTTMVPLIKPRPHFPPSCSAGKRSPWYSRYGEERGTFEREKFFREGGNSDWIVSLQVPWCVLHSLRNSSPCTPEQIFFFLSLLSSLSWIHPRRKEATPVTYLIRGRGGGGATYTHEKRETFFFGMYVSIYHATPLHFHYCFVSFFFLITENGINWKSIRV